MNYYVVVCNTASFYCIQLSGNLQPLRDCRVNEERCWCSEDGLVGRGPGGGWGQLRVVQGDWVGA